jgi:sigma-B regulation protein RsbU (phosphoserine phosphatase)
LAGKSARLKRDLEAAARVQKALLPTALPDVARVRFAWTFRPCEELAGDILNIYQLDSAHVGFYLLDVSGHGVPANGQ